MCLGTKYSNMRRGGRDGLDIEGGDRPAFAQYEDDDKKGKGGAKGGGVMGALSVTISQKYSLEVSGH